MILALTPPKPKPSDGELALGSVAANWPCTASGLLITSDFYKGMEESYPFGINSWLRSRTGPPLSQRPEAVVLVNL
jgi:hypothetical protein